jgi:hypothetical protein
LNQFRAIVAAIAVFWAVVASLPMPGPGSASALQDPTAQRELADWSLLLGSLGLSVPPERLGEGVLAIGEVARTAQSTATWPVRPLVRQLAIQQGWGLFAYPDREPVRLIVEGDAGDRKYHAIFRSLDPKARWEADWFAYRRVRAMMSPGRKLPATFRGVVDQVAARAFRDHPALVRVRVRFETFPISVPGEPASSARVRTRYQQIRERTP